MGIQRLRSLGNRAPSSSAFVCPYRLFGSSRFFEKTYAKPAIENAIQVLKIVWRYSGTTVPKFRKITKKKTGP
jgi:hypothetical protein